MKSMILRKRVNHNYVTIPTDVIKTIGDQNVPRDVAAVALYNFVSNSISVGKIYTHDKVWLTTIMNWTPPNTGLSMTDIAKWIDFAKKIEKIDEDKDEVKFNFSDNEINLMFNKLKNPDFRIAQVSTSLLHFLEDLQDATGMTINKESKEEK